MKLYIGHSRVFNYKEELYQPIRNSQMNSEHEFIFPHENEKEMNTKEIIQTCDIMIAEVSFPSTGLGIELGWADDFQRPIICLCRKDTKISDALKTVYKKCIEYADTEDMIRKLDSALKKIDNENTILRDCMKIHHVSITVNNLEESRKFYEEFFGFTLSKSFEREDMGARAVFLELDGFFLELWEFHDLHVNRDDLQDIKVKGIRHIAFEVEDLDAVVSHFRQHGLQMTGPTLGSSGNSYSHTSDPNGVVIELYQK